MKCLEKPRVSQKGFCKFLEILTPTERIVPVVNISARPERSL